MQASAPNPHGADVPYSRCFVVCGKAITAEELQAAFCPFGNIQSVKVIRDKGVAYVKYDKASSAALAIEGLNGAVLNNGRGPKLKVLLAEAPMARGLAQPSIKMADNEVSSDPDNVPARSRLFIVVPKQADAQQIKDDLQQFDELEYCKTDLIAAKGVVFCKFKKSSAAMHALEGISERGTVASYKVKVMLAEPKTKRVRADGSPQDFAYHMSQAPKLDWGAGLPMDQLKLGALGTGVAGLSPGQMSMSDYAALGLTGGLGNFNAALASNMNNLAAQEMQQISFGLVNGLGSLQPGSPVSPNNAVGTPMLSRQRLFVVVHKGVAEDALARLFRRYPGMEYCDLKKDRATGKSRGYCYINYSTPEAAAAAVKELNGMEFPPHSGHRIKVMFAEPLGVRASGGSSAANNSLAHSGGVPRSPVAGAGTSSPSPVRTPLSHTLTPDVSSLQNSLSGMSISRGPGAAAGGPGAAGAAAAAMVEDAAQRLASPAVARELMFVA